MDIRFLRNLIFIPLTKVASAHRGITYFQIFWCHMIDETFSVNGVLEMKLSHKRQILWICVHTWNHKKGICTFANLCIPIKKKGGGGGVVSFETISNLGVVFAFVTDDGLCLWIWTDAFRVRVRNVVFPWTQKGYTLLVLFLKWYSFLVCII